MNYILFDDISWKNLLPLTFVRPVCEIRIGILTIKEKWEKKLNCEISHKTQVYLSGKFPLKTNSSKSNIWINGKVCPNDIVVQEIQNLNHNEVLVDNKEIIAVNTGKEMDFDPEASKPDYKFIESNAEALMINFPWEIFTKNGEAFKEDFKLLTNDRLSEALSPSNKVIGVGRVFLEKGANVECALLNTSNGDIYIASDAVVMEGAMIRGPFALLDHAEVKMGAKVYGPSTFGPYCKIGGEVNNSVFFGFSNKAHDGFIGNSVIAEWCNLGADTNNSNLKNNYGNVRIWNYNKEEMLDTGLQFCGLIMGDHSKCGINTMFNTGTVVGINANIFGADFPIHFISSFSWGGAEEFEDYRLDKALSVAEKVMSRRNITLTDEDKSILTYVFERTKRHRVEESF